MTAPSKPLVNRISLLGTVVELGLQSLRPTSLRLGLLTLLLSLVGCGQTGELSRPEASLAFYQFHNQKTFNQQTHSQQISEQQVAK